MTAITWSQIEAECGDYRAGFVATFRKYEGRDTDELAGNGQIVKVTYNSFARHMGITETTFRRWAGTRDQEKDGQRAAGAASRFARNLPAEEKAKLAAELLDDDEVAEHPDVAETIESKVAASPAATARVNQAAAQHRPTPPSPAPERTSMSAAASAAALEAAAAQLRRATDETVADVMDGQLNPELLAEPLASIETDAKRLRIACDTPENIDQGLADLLRGEDQ